MADEVFRDDAGEDRDQDEQYHDGKAAQGGLVALEAEPEELARRLPLDGAATLVTSVGARSTSLTTLTPFPSRS